jgi:sugar diacid utilization regulator
LAAATAARLGDASTRALVDVAGSMFELHNAYSAAAVSGYRDESRQILRTTERERAALVEAVLTGTAAHGTLWEVAQALRLPVDGAFVVVAAEAVDVGHDPLPRIESVIAGMDVASVWRLQPDVLVGVVSLHRRERLDALLEALRRHATGRIGVSPVFPELRQAAWALRLARIAQGNRTAGPGVAQFVDSPLNVLVAAAPQAAMEAARTVLGELLDLPADDRDLLLATFTAWLDADGSAAGAAATLFCHPNTVRYRLRRIEERTHRTLASPSDAAELVTAVRAWSQLPLTTSPGIDRGI